MPLNNSLRRALKGPMHRPRIVFFLALFAALLLASPTVFADEHEGEEAPAESEPTESEGEDAAAEDAEASPEGEEGSKESLEVTSEEDDDGEDDGESEEEGEEDDAPKSEHGSYEWKLSWGAGFEYGLFFTELERWNTHLFEPNDVDTVDASFMGVTDFAVEVSPLEGLRLTGFFGIAALYSGPSLLMYYGGLEPAFAVRRGIWELAAGVGVGGGAISLETDNDGSGDGTLLMVRPFLEPRVYPTEWMAIYLRVAFNLFRVMEWDSDDLPLTPLVGQEVDEDQLSESGLYASLGFRFGSYPEHVKVVPDTDGDGYRDDIDDCPEKAEDFDQFEDEDGCPEDDNDKDGIPDDSDGCPDTPEDLDGWKDDDGCPETDDDRDGDGILDKDDDCPEKAEDFDQFEDDDGCPDEDNDGDGILDEKDKCPNEPGVPQKQGCPWELVEVTADQIRINEKVMFEFDKAVIKPESHNLLNTVANTIKENPRIKLIEVAGHTDHEGKRKYNLELSQARAEAVRDYLVEQGVDEARLQAKGYGFDKPLVPLPADGKETEAAAAKNRRVEFNILEQDQVKKIMREDKVPEGADVKPVPKEKGDDGDGGSDDGGSDDGGDSGQDD